MNCIFSPYRLLVSVIAMSVLFSSGNASAQNYRWHAGINSADTNIKYKSRTVITYQASDSTLADKKLNYKETTTYNTNFDQDAYLKENVNGKKLEDAKNTYDAAGNLMGYIRHDSMGKVMENVSYIYD